jgi:hypothetical protein
MAPISTPDKPEIVAQAGALIGDEAVNAARHVVEPEVNTEPVDAQVAPERDAAAASVTVHETVVHTDRVITDPSSPEAVQIPDAGRGDARLPIHQLGEPTPEQVFAGEEKESDEAPASTPDETPTSTPDETPTNNA